MQTDKKKSIIKFAILSALIVIFIILSVMDFKHKLNNNEYQIQQEIMRETADKESTIVETEINSYVHTLHTVAELAYQDSNGLQINKEFFLSLLQHEHFKRLSVIHPDGTMQSMDANGKITTINISDRDYFVTVMNGGTAVTGIKDSRITDNKVFIIAVPIKTKTGAVIGGIHGAVNLDDFQMNEAGRIGLKQQNTYVIDRNGNYILRGKEGDSSWEFNSIFDMIATSNSSVSNEQIMTKLQTGEQFSIDLIIDGEKHLTVFSPININNWYSVVAMPWSVVDHHVNELLDKEIYILLTKVLCAVGVLIATIIYQIQKEREKERTQEADLREHILSGIIGFVEADVDENTMLQCSEKLGDKNTHFTSFSEFLNNHIENEVHPDYRELVEKDLSLDGICSNYSKGITKKMLEYPIMLDNDRIGWRECEINIDENEENEHIVVYTIFRDIDDKKNKEMRLRFKAERDGLTGLYNRSTAQDLTEHFLTHLNKDDKYTHAFIILDLDNFKKLNDTLGHKMGDRALMEVAGTLTGYFRREDIVCRLGGDEFVVFMKRIPKEAVMTKLAPLMEYLTLTYEEDGVSVTISASAGIAMTPENGKSFKELYDHADLALYDIKKTKKGSFKFYDASLGEKDESDQ